MEDPCRLIIRLVIIESTRRVSPECRLDKDQVLREITSFDQETNPINKSQCSSLGIQNYVYQNCRSSFCNL